jgi:hypothetical protein
MGLEIAAGPTNTVVIDRQKMYWMAGKVYKAIFFLLILHQKMTYLPTFSVNSGRTLAMAQPVNLTLHPDTFKISCTFKSCCLKEIKARLLT